MAQYNPNDIEKKWQQYWEDEGTFKATENTGKQPYYILDMFPYPSGAGLHVGHPLGYIASDIIARYKRLKGFEVLHPMGYDAFGLPAEQYAIDTGNHPAGFTDKNIDRYREQLKMIGLSFDWSREVKTSDPSYYKWTQWIFIQFFNSWYNISSNKAESIDDLVKEFETKGNRDVRAFGVQLSGKKDTKTGNFCPVFSAETWRNFSEEEKQKILLKYRLAYIGESEVNWCPALGTVLANEEVKDGFSERGGYPVERRMMKQWFLRITAYADRLLNDLNDIDWPQAVREMQTNWIGRSVGAEVDFSTAGSGEAIRIFTTRPDTIFGSTFMVLAPEHELVQKITTNDKKDEVEQYINQTKRKSERERKAETKVSGVFTGAYAINPFTKKQIPVWIADYVLAEYGTGAIMAVPGHDSRDWAFAKKFNLPIIEVVEGGNVQEASYDAKEGSLMNSDFLNGLTVDQAIVRAINEIEQNGLGKRQVNYRLRDANFSRQRYWGEPFPIIYKNGIPYPIPFEELPVMLPDVESYRPTGTGESPLASAEKWVNTDEGLRETNTMPGWAGSSWYFLRYMDPENNYEFVDREKELYWKNVDFYIGGAEHATGHLLYARFWHKFLFDRGLVTTKEPFKKLINQGMIQGRSSIVYRIVGTNKFVSLNLKDSYQVTELHVDVNIVENDVLNVDVFRSWRTEFADAEFILENGKYICGYEIEKMSKRWFNVVTPDDVIAKYGCDAFRMYEMFLGPIEQSKPWDTKGIDGVSRFLRKFWALFYDREGFWIVNNDIPTPDELKILHKTIKRIEEDIERFNLNTCISTFMIAVNDLTPLQCHKKEILEPLVILLAPFAPHVAEELWKELGHKASVAYAPFPVYVESYIAENSFEYPVSINGKMRVKVELPLSLTKEQVEEHIKTMDLSKWTDGKPFKKIIVVPGKIVNVVI
jgi:leucyl-tRNA synthetase